MGHITRSAKVPSFSKISKYQMLIACLFRILLCQSENTGKKNPRRSDVCMQKSIAILGILLSFYMYVLMTCSYFPSKRRHFLISLMIRKWLSKLNLPVPETGVTVTTLLR